MQQSDDDDDDDDDDSRNDDDDDDSRNDDDDDDSRNNDDDDDVTRRDPNRQPGVPGVTIVAPPVVRYLAGNGERFVEFELNLRNNGSLGTLRETFLRIDLDDDDDDDDDGCLVRGGVITDDDDDDDGRRYRLLDVTFREGVGFVRDICDDDIIIGIGPNNLLAPGQLVRVRVVIQDRRPTEGDDTVLILMRHDRSGGRQLIDRIRWR